MGEKSSVIPKAEALKKAGFHPVTTILIIVLSTPGIWGKFIDDDDDVARAAIEKAYPLLKRDVEESKEHAKKQVEINQKLLIEIAKIRTTLSIVHGIDTEPSETALEGLFPAAGDGDGDGDEEGAGEPPASFDMEPPPDDPEPASLDHMIKQQQAPKGKELPDLGELLGEK